MEKVLRPEFVEEIQGDMEELYTEHLETYTPAKAKRLFWLDTLKLLRPNLLRHISLFTHLTGPTMFKNHLKIAFRVFGRDKVYTGINLVGMSLGLAMALLILLYVRFELSYESYNPNAEQIVRLTIDYMDGGTIADQDCETYPGIGPRMIHEMAEVSNFTRAYNLEDLTVRIGETSFNEKLNYAVDTSFFELMNYPLVHGDPNTIFRNPFEVVLPKHTALKFFNRLDVVGEKVFFPKAGQDLVVVGVVEDAPPTTHLKFDILISYITMVAAMGESDDNWNGNNTFTYIQLHPQNTPEQFASSLIAFNDKLHKEEKLE
ncbi:MAG: ABC transporter permease, partial [Bacteroidota bacterium]